MKILLIDDEVYNEIGLGIIPEFIDCMRNKIKNENFLLAKKMESAVAIMGKNPDINYIIYDPTLLEINQIHTGLKLKKDFFNDSVINIKELLRLKKSLKILVLTNAEINEYASLKDIYSGNVIDIISKTTSYSDVNELTLNILEKFGYD